jgi:hypothetical protein
MDWAERRWSGVADMAVPLAEAIRELGEKRHEEGHLDADHVLSVLRFKSMLDLLPSTDEYAVIAMDGDRKPSRKPCTHRRLRKFVSEEVALHRFGVGRNDRVAILLPNGPELATAFVAVLTYCTCAPLNPANTVLEIKGELISAGAKAIILQAGEDDDGILAVAEELGLVDILATPSPSEAGIFSLTDTFDTVDGKSDPEQDDSRFKPQGREDTVRSNLYFLCPTDASAHSNTSSLPPPWTRRFPLLSLPRTMSVAAQACTRAPTARPIATPAILPQPAAQLPPSGKHLNLAMRYVSNPLTAR